MDDHEDSGSDDEVLDRATLKSRAAAVGSQSNYCVPKPFPTRNRRNSASRGSAQTKSPADESTSTPATRAEVGRLQNGKLHITITDFSFTPNHVRIPVGTRVVFTVDQSEMAAVEYTVCNMPVSRAKGTASDNVVLAEFESPALTRGMSFEWRFVNVGQVRFHDPSYPEMEGILEVVRSGMSAREIREMQQEAVAEADAITQALADEAARTRQREKERKEREEKELEAMDVVANTTDEPDEVLEARYYLVQDSLAMYRAQREQERLEKEAQTKALLGQQ